MKAFFILAMDCMNTAIEHNVNDISLDKRDLADKANYIASAAVA